MSASTAAMIENYSGPYNDIICLHRPYSRRLRMDRGRRAKQFAPFSALKGLEDNVHSKEEIYVPMSDLSEETQNELDRKLRLLKYHDQITLTYFQKNPAGAAMTGQYKDVTGPVEYIDPLHRYIRIGETDINISEIRDLT